MCEWVTSHLEDSVSNEASSPGHSSDHNLPKPPFNSRNQGGYLTWHGVILGL